MNPDIKISKALKKCFGGLELTWPRLLIASVLAGVYTAAVAILPALQNTSFHTIAVSFEVWVLFGILIIYRKRERDRSGPFSLWRPIPPRIAACGP